MPSRETAPPARPAHAPAPPTFPSKLAMAVVVATLLFGRQIASWTEPRNRFLFHWQAQDGLALVLGLLGLAGLFVALGLVLPRLAAVRRRRLHEIGFLALVALGLLAQVQGLAGLHSFWAGLVLWIAVLAAIHRARRRWRGRLLGWVARGCLVLSPLAPILLLQILSWPALDLTERGADPTPLQPTPRHPPVVVLVFDEWSWPRSHADGRLRGILPHFAELAERSLMARNALSPGGKTWTALPGLLFQRPGTLTVRRQGAFWIENGSRRPAREVPNLFGLAHRHGYRGHLEGYYFPYREMLGSEVDLVRSHAKYAKGDGLAGAVGLALARNLEFWADPFSQAAWVPLDTWLTSENWRAITERQLADLRVTLGRIDDGAFLFAHLTMPHAPFVFDRQGTYLGPQRRKRSLETPEQYEEQLRFADRILGDLVRTLETAGRFDRTLLIVTSDHAWRLDRNADDPLADRRVPLLIKWPGQATPLVVDEPFCTVRLAPFLEAVMGSGDPAPLTFEAWQTLGAEGRTAATAVGQPTDGAP